MNFLAVTQVDKTAYNAGSVIGGVLVIIGIVVVVLLVTRGMKKGANAVAKASKTKK